MPNVTSSKRRKTSLSAWIERMRFFIGSSPRSLISSSDVAAAGVDQAANHLALDAHHVGHEVLSAPVHRFRILVIETLDDTIWADERYFCGLSRHAADKRIFLQRKIAHETELLRHRTALQDRRAVGDVIGIPALQRFPLAR